MKHFLIDKNKSGPRAISHNLPTIQTLSEILSHMKFKRVLAKFLSLFVAASLLAGANHVHAAETHYHTVAVNGVNIFYRESGDTNKPAILLLHGFPASSFMYRELITSLSDQFHVIAPDYPGFGYSDAPSTKDFAYSFDKLAEIMDDFTRVIGIRKYALYMQDFGGPVGFRLASQHPERVLFLVIQNANAYEEGLPDDFWALAKQLWKDPSKENFDKVREAAISNDALEWNYTHGVQDKSRTSPDDWMLQQLLVNRPGNKDIMLALLYDYRNNLPRYQDWQAYFRKYQPPTLIVWGAQDKIFPASGAYPYKRDLMNLEFHVLETGHFALEDYGDFIAQCIKNFSRDHPNMAAQAPSK